MTEKDFEMTEKNLVISVRMFKKI